MFVEFNLRLKVASVVEFLNAALREFHSLRADGRNELKKKVVLVAGTINCWGFSSGIVIVLELFVAKVF